MPDERFQRIQQDLQHAAGLVGEAVTLLAGIVQETEALRLDLRIGVRPTDVLCDVAPTEHRRKHRPGTVPRIDSDPELEAFIRARIDRLTFVEIAAQVAQTFPKARRVGKSAIHAWWARQKPRHG